MRTNTGKKVAAFLAQSIKTGIDLDILVDSFDDAAKAVNAVAIKYADDHLKYRPYAQDAVVFSIIATNLRKLK